MREKFEAMKTEILVNAAQIILSHKNPNMEYISIIESILEERKLEAAKNLEILLKGQKVVKRLKDYAFADHK